MENRDYTDPAYETAEAYNQAWREENNPYGSYGSAYNTYQQQKYTNLSGKMVDEKGKVLNNNFAIKLVLSILMIVLCCCCGFLTAIIGMIALVFTCLANSAYNQGSMSEFKANARVSTVLLFLGGGLAVLMLSLMLMFAAMLGSESGEFDELYSALYEELYGTEYNDEEDWGDDEGLGWSEEYTGINTMPLVADFNQFMLNGVAYSVPMSFDEFQSMGYSLVEFDSSKVLLAGEFEGYDFIIDEQYSGIVRISNNGYESAVITQCEVDYFCVYSNSVYAGTGSKGIADLDVYILGNLSSASSYEDVEKVLGTPYYVCSTINEKGEEDIRYRWEYNGSTVFQAIEISFINDEIYDVSIDHYEY